MITKLLTIPVIWIGLLIAIGFFVVIFLMIFFHNCAPNKRKVVSQTAQKKFIRALESSLAAESPQEPHILKKCFRKPLAYLPTLEKFEQEKQSEVWHKLKHDLGETYLLPIARKLVISSKDVKRHYAARLFSFLPKKEDEASYLILLKDSFKLNRFLIAKVAIHVPTDPILKAMTQQMCEFAAPYRLPYMKILREGRRRSTSVAPTTTAKRSQPRSQSTLYGHPSSYQSGHCQSKSHQRFRG